MLTFTHTYLLNLAFQKINQADISENRGELILGNVIPDFVTHLGRSQFQALAHHLAYFRTLDQAGDLEWGAIFHILCDNYSTLGKISFEGSYHDFPRDGFIEKLSRKVIINIPLQIPKRRILQCSLDILVIREQKELLVNMLKAAELSLRNNFNDVTHRIAKIYGIESNQLVTGLNRFSRIYGNEFVELAASEEYRLFPLTRSLLNLDSLTNPQIILEGVRKHPELMEVIELNMELIRDNWHDLLEDTVQEVMKYPGIRETLK